MNTIGKRQPNDFKACPARVECDACPKGRLFLLDVEKQVGKGKVLSKIVKQIGIQGWLLVTKSSVSIFHGLFRNKMTGFFCEG